MASSSSEGTAALEKALDLLEAVGASQDGLSQAELAQRFALPRTTAYRLLATLVARGLLRRDPVRRAYCLGMRCFEMARQAYAMPDLAAAAALELRALRDLTGETSYLAALDGREVVSLERCDGAHSERSSSALGQRKPVHCTSQGKAILSALPAADRETLLRGLSLKAVTPRTITDRRRLQAELRVTAARGYAIDDEEIVPGVRCVGAPIVDAQGEVRGALSVAGPAWRLTPERLELLGPELAEAARRVGAQLGRTRAPVADTMACALAGPWAFHGAHPHWCAEANLLYWADSLAPALRAWSPQAAPDGEPREAGAAPLPAGTDQALAECDEPIAGVLVHGPQDVSLAGARGAVRWRPGAAQREPWPAWPDGAAVRAACLGGADGDGESVWIAMETAGGGSAVGRLQAAGNVEVLWRLAEALQCLRWRAGDGALLATVPDTGAILHMHPDSPGVVRRLVTVPKGSGRVSGLAFDAEGGVWTALRDGWSVVRFLPDGGLDRVAALPVPCPTDVAIGGAEGRTLFVTTARQPVALDLLANAPLSGRLFALPL
ncbi:IclR family transcriptional regulator C-terminal domain-containing protein [Paracidovorax citrulli]|uniref:IclR family transcriptional regulator domain-containing protein n=1 Tax=Paracidovorax citrulli TaxID=80869 RepID=UPI000662962E|nr:IclR family transcriptional regulator C-terminal domain-containing protein [Paracidovorax citrulli]QCX10800.1 Transcriptional regulator KdgR [Paracidovorax citrulli]UEG46225.1 SMP-30/gluconolactonase/LRE family protein [Paracidovorax citrulli]UMT90496.1 helix-turn-helix domain-containing protein [Paracidovorax citrulli]UMT94533.1 helix-turn-helix domain-containing protein [Paracidovorax citrulli]WIY34683.1 IclR family transcriptional regulator C-terminal domain-containing protein [Paracidov